MTKDVRKLLTDIELQEQREFQDWLEDPEVFEELVQAFAEELSVESDLSPNGFGVAHVARPQRSADAPDIIGAIERVAGRVVDLWAGLIGAFAPLPMESEALAGSTDVPELSGIELPLVDIIPNAVLKNELAWAEGKLRVLCARSREGNIRSLQVSVGRSGMDAEGADLVLELRDPEGRVETFNLHEQQSSMVTRPSLVGEFRSLKLSVALRLP